MERSTGPNRTRPWLAAEGWMALTQAWVILYWIGVPEPVEPIVTMAGMILLPGFNIAFFLLRCRWAVALMASFCLAPLAAGLSGYLILSGGLGPAAGSLAPALITMPLAGAAVFFPTKERRKVDGGMAAALGIGGLFLLITAGLLFTGIRVRLSSHGLLHSAIVYQIIDTGIPPENPFFAGQPLVYYWFYHLAAAGMSLASNLSPLVTLSFLNLPAAACVVPCLYLVGRRLGFGQGSALLGAVIGLLALNPLGPLFFALREPDVTLDQIEQGLVPGSLVQALTLGFDLRLGSALTKFWNISSFPSAIALFLLGIYTSLSASRPGWRTFILIFLPAFGLILTNPLAGICLFLPLGLASLAWLGTGHVRSLLVTVVALVAAGGACLPYFLLITEGAEGGGSFIGTGPSQPAMLGVALAAGPVLLFAAFGLKIARAKFLQPDQRAAILFQALFVSGLVIMALFLTFPMENEYKIIRLLIFPAGVLAGPAAALFFKQPGVRRIAAVLLAAGVLIPSNAIAFFIYLGSTRAEVPLDDAGFQIEITAADLEKREVYAILRDETPKDAVVVVDPKDRYKALGGKMQGDELPALARRALYTGHMFYLTERYPDFQDRIERTARLFLNEDGPLPEPLPDRPLFVLVRSDRIPEPLKPPRFEKIYQGRYMALYRVNEW